MKFYAKDFEENYVQKQEFWLKLDKNICLFT